MPRRRRAEKINFPPRSIQIPIQVLTNQHVKDQAYRLYSLIIALSYKTGSCQLNDTQLADLMRCSRQYVSRLLGELSAIDLVADTTLDDGQRQLIAIDPSDLDNASLDGRRLLEPAGTDLAQAPYKNGRASRPSAPPQKVLSTEIDIKSVCATGDNTKCATDGNISAPVVVVELINRDIESTTTTTPKSATSDNVKSICATGDNINCESATRNNIKPLIDTTFAEIAGRWTRYFGDISPVEGDLLGDYLDDDDLAGAAGANAEAAKDWILAAIEETAMAKARTPVKYFRKIMNEWIKKKTRRKQDDNNNSQTHQPDSADDVAKRRADVERQIAALEAAIATAA